MKTSQNIKKFQFFDDEKDTKGGVDLIGVVTKAKFSLNEITPTQMENKNGFIFIIGSVRHIGNEEKGADRSMIKVYKNQVIEEYELFNTQIFHFKIVSLQSKDFMIAYGCDKVKEENNEQILTSVKIYDISMCYNKSQPLKPELLKVIYVMSNANQGLVTGKGCALKDCEAIQNSACMDVNDCLSSIAIGLTDGNIIYIAAKPNLFDPVLTSFKYLQDIIDDNDACEITNIAFAKWSYYPYLYFTTDKNIYYFKFDDKKEEGFNLKAEAGAMPDCFNMKPEENKFITLTAAENYIVQYEHFEKGLSLFLEGKKKFVSYFKNYYAFIACEDNIVGLGIYDNNNKFFAYYNNNFNKILNVSHDRECMYVFVENESNEKVILTLKEKDNKDKFETFYKKKFFDTAFEYAKNLKYDKKTLSEISIKHADFLYKKGDYAKAIDQFIATINYLDPSHVIIKFLDGAKLDHLIAYLEALQKDDQMKRTSTPDEMKNYTALLLNCYIKQKKLEKLQTFVEEKNLNDQLIDIATAIDVCKDSNQAELALSIAEKSHLTDAHIQILIEMKDDYKKALEVLDSEKDQAKKLYLFLQYGDKFLDNKPKDTMNCLRPLVEHIIKIKNNTTMADISQEEREKFENINYDKILQIFHNKDKELVELINFILEKDKNCPASIIHRRIELYYDQYLREDKKNQKIVDDIKETLKNEQYFSKIDKNYLMMYFNTNEFTQGVTDLTERMNLLPESFQLYLDSFNYQKLMEFCSKYGKEDVNYYIQALIFFMNINNTVGAIETNIKKILEKVMEHELLSPILLIEIMGKTKTINYFLIKEFLLGYLNKQQKIVDDDKRYVEENYRKIEKLNIEIKDLHQKSKQFPANKCSICSQTLYLPATYFFCGHGFHSICLNAEMKDDMQNSECTICKTKSMQFAQRIKQSEEKANDHNTFFTDLHGKQRKNDMIAEYLGKGIFDMDK